MFQRRVCRACRGRDERADGINGPFTRGVSIFAIDKLVCHNTRLNVNSANCPQMKTHLAVGRCCWLSLSGGVGSLHIYTHINTKYVVAEITVYLHGSHLEHFFLKWFAVHRQ